MIPLTLALLPWMEFKFVMVAVIVIVVLLVVFTGVPGGKSVDKQDRVCRSCRLAHPYFAQFCRKCGSKL